LGVAYGDDLGVATPLAALVVADPEKRWNALGRIVRDRRITDLVLGYPYNMDGTAGPKAREVDGFAARLRTVFGLPIHLVDERLTSYEAESTIARKQRRALRPTGIIDSRAATLVLQDFLDHRAPPDPGLP
jgi:putative Holliday junction resolvase